MRASRTVLREAGGEIPPAYSPISWRFQEQRPGTAPQEPAPAEAGGEPERVRVHDFKIPELGKVAPYGIYDIAANTGWVNVGIDHDTAAFAVESIRRWWCGFGRNRYPAATRLLITADCGATRLLITADCGGSNGARVRLWKRELQSFANQSGLSITVTHHPPGTSSRVDDWRGGFRS